MRGIAEEIAATVRRPARLLGLFDGGKRMAFFADQPLPEPPTIADQTIAEVIAQHHCDYLDFGCKDGASLRFGREAFGGKAGLGIDIRPDQVAISVAKGYRAVVGDVTDLNVPDKCVDFVLLFHFLEHMPSCTVARECIATALRAARKFVFIRHPWFDSDAELLRLGYKMYWSDWGVHPSHFNSLEFIKAIRRLNVEGRWCLMGHRQIHDTRHPALIPLFSSGRLADESESASRPAVGFSSPVYHNIACLIQTGSVEDYERARAALDSEHVVFMEGEGSRVFS